MAVKIAFFALLAGVVVAMTPVITCNQIMCHAHAWLLPAIGF